MTFLEKFGRLEGHPTALGGLVGWLGDALGSLGNALAVVWDVLEPSWTGLGAVLGGCVGRPRRSWGVLGLLWSVYNTKLSYSVWDAVLCTI